MAFLLKDGQFVGPPFVWVEDEDECCRVCWYEVRIRYVCEDEEGGDFEAPFIADKECLAQDANPPGPTGWTLDENASDECEFEFYKWVSDTGEEGCPACEQEGDCGKSASDLIDANDRPAEPDCSDCADDPCTNCDDHDATAFVTSFSGCEEPADEQWLNDNVAGAFAFQSFAIIGGVCRWWWRRDGESGMWWDLVASYDPATEKWTVTLADGADMDFRDEDANVSCVGGELSASGTMSSEGFVAEGCQAHYSI